MLQGEIGGPGDAQAGWYRVDVAGSIYTMPRRPGANTPHRGAKCPQLAVLYTTSSGGLYIHHTRTTGARQKSEECATPALHDRAGAVKTTRKPTARRALLCGVRKVLRSLGASGACDDITAAAPRCCYHDAHAVRPRTEFWCSRNPGH
jgi:hypothetical protein